jgi:tungstate transport system substrate-binding protein
MELSLWKEAGIDLASVRRRESTGQGMGATLNVADQRRGYTLTDRATYLALKGRLSLVPVFEGDPKLLNIYHAYAVNPTKHSGVKAKEAEQFVAFLVQPTTQQAIGEFGRSRFGQSLFIPDAGKDSTQLIRR